MPDRAKKLKVKVRVRNLQEMTSKELPEASLGSRGR
jgi:hypothetical protein